MHSAPLSTRNTGLRVFSACLLSALLILLPFVQLNARVRARESGAGSRESEQGSSPTVREGVNATALNTTINPALPGPVAAPLGAPIITATKVDTYSSQPGPALPGETITYTVTITNSGADPATGVMFNDTPDANTMLVGGSVMTQPVAFNDTYNVIGNVRIQPNAAQGVLANDIDPDTGNNTGLTITTLAGDATAPFAGTSTQGGQVTAATGDGSFQYNPPPGFTGSDTFTYTISDGAQTDTATVTLTVNEVIWFVDDSAAVGGDGRLTSPFNCYTGANSGAQTCFSATAADDPGDNIFLFEGNYTGGNTLLNNQKLIGQGATGTLASIAAVTVEAYSDALPATGGANPTITTSVAATNGVNLGQGNTLRGFTVGNTTGVDIFGNNFGTLTVGNNVSPDVTLNGTGQALNLTTGTFAATSAFSSVTTTSSGGQGINLAGTAGTVSFGSTTVSGATTQGILIGTSTADINLGNTSVTGGTDGISFQNNSAGTRTVGTLNVSGGSASAVVHGAGGGNVTVTGNAMLNSAGANVIDIQGVTVGTTINFQGTTTINKNTAGTGVSLNSFRSVTFNQLDVTTSNGIAVAATGPGTLTTSSGTLNATGNSAINANSMTFAGTGLTSVSATGGTNPGIRFISVAGVLNAGTGTLTGNAGAACFDSQTSTASFSYAGALNQTNAQRIINITTNTGGTYTFSGAVTSNNGTGQGISLTNNAGATINFTGGINLSTGANAAFTATGGGTVSATQNNTTIINTLTTTTGTALNVANTTIGASGLTFRSISSNGGSDNGIILDTTGSSGGLTVVGDGTNTSVGGNSSGGTIANKAGADGSATQGTGIYLNTTSNVVLRRMTINGTNQNFGIRGFAVNNFTLEYSTVDGTNGTATSLPSPNTAGEGSVYFGNLTTNGMTGTGTVTNCIFGGGRHRNFSVINTAGTLNRLTITGSTFNSNQSFMGASGESFSVEARNSGTVLNTTVRGSTFTGAPGDLVEWVAQSGTTMDVIFGGAAAGQPNTLTNNHPQNVIGGGGVTVASAGTLTFNISNNTMRDANGSAVTMQLAAPLAGSTEFRSINGTFNANTIGAVGVAGSGSATGNGIFLSFADNTTAPKSLATIALTNNTIRNYNGNAAIYADNTGGNYDVNAIITGNVATNPGPLVFAGLALTAGGPPPANDDIDVCAQITGNDFSTAQPLNADEIIVGGGSSGLSSMRLPGFAGANLTDVQNFIRNNNLNPGTTAVTAYQDNAGPLMFTGGAACTSPSAMVLPGVNQREYFARVDVVQQLSPNIGSAVASLLTGRIVAVADSDAAITATKLPIAQFETTVAQGIVQTKLPSDEQKRAAQSDNQRSGLKGHHAAARPEVGGQSSGVRAHHAPPQQKPKPVKPATKPVANGPGGIVSVNIGTLNPGDSVTITFQVTINSPFGGGPQVSNQGTVSGTNFMSVLTDDPAVGGAADPTVTPVLANPDISINDAKEPEPASGTSNMLFTVALTSPAPPSGVSVNYATANGGGNPATGGANCATMGTDYVTSNGTVNFSMGQQVKTVAVEVCSDTDNAETDETLLVNLSMAMNGTIVDGMATGTIMVANPAGTALISEIRHFGPGAGNDANDEFVEIYNNTDSPVTVTASDASAGWGLYKMGAMCTDTPVLLGTIPNGTVIPARGHYLFTGTAYSLGNYGGTGAAAGNLTLAAEIEANRNVALFSTGSLTNISSANRLDAVGFGMNTGGVCDLFREGATQPALTGAPDPLTSLGQHSYFRKLCDFVGGVGCSTPGRPKDTNANAADFLFANASLMNAGAGALLGAPGPENLASPIKRDPQVNVVLLDASVTGATSPNRVRDTTADPGNNSAFGTLTVRRRIVNNTGGTVTRLRFRVVELTTAPPPGGIADLRARTSMMQVGVGPIGDAATCAATGTPATPPCTVTVNGLTLETPPAQANGGGLNSSLSAGTITMGAPLANGASINVQFLLGVQQTGTFRFLIIVEALP